MAGNTALVISPERGFLRRLTTSLQAAGGAVDPVESLQASFAHFTDSDVVVYHAATLPDESIAKLPGLLKGDQRLVLLIPRTGPQDLIPSLAHTHVTSVLSAGASDARTLAGVASRNFFGNVFGLERYMPWGVHLHSSLISDYRDKTIALGALTRYCKEMGVRRKYVDSIERVADELLMNALYDAPLAAGDAEAADPAGMRGKIVMQHSCDGELFGLSVTDHYGSMRKETLIAAVSRCLESSDARTTGEGGAGIGLYLVSSSCSQLIYNVLPGKATEVIALFDLRAPKIRLTHLSYFDAQPRRELGPSWLIPRPPLPSLEQPSTEQPPPWLLNVVLLIAVVVVLALSVFVVVDAL